MIPIHTESLVLRSESESALLVCIKKQIFIFILSEKL